MTIIKIEPNDNGSYSNQTCSIDFPAPEGWAVVPPELEQQTLELLPWVLLELEDGVIVGISDNAEARAAAAAQPPAEPEPTQLDRVEAQVTYTAMMTDTLLEV